MPETSTKFLWFLKLDTAFIWDDGFMVGGWDSNHQDDMKANHHCTVLVQCGLHQLQGGL